MGIIYPTVWSDLTASLPLSRRFISAACNTYPAYLLEYKPNINPWISIYIIRQYMQAYKYFRIKVYILLNLYLSLWYNMWGLSQWFPVHCTRPIPPSILNPVTFCHYPLRRNTVMTYNSCGCLHLIDCKCWTAVLDR